MWELYHFCCPLVKKGYEKLIKGNAVAAAESMNGKIDNRYCLRTDKMFEIINHFGVNRPFEILNAGFNLGYLEGQKAEKARFRNAK